MSEPAAPLPEWEQVLSAASRLQRLLPDAVRVGDTASAVHAGHRFSRDADRVLPDLRARFDAVLAELEAVAGWKTARVQRPVQILGRLDGIETGVRQLIRTAPLETEQIELKGTRLTVPKPAEMLRIKAVLVLKRNATRDYLDVAALADRLGDDGAAQALRPFDALYPQDSGESPLQQLHVQLAAPLPYDLEATDLTEYQHLVARWRDWNAVHAACARLAVVVFDRLCAPPDGPTPAPRPTGRPPRGPSP